MIINSVLILVAGVIATIITRFLPFAVLNGKHGEHPIVVYLGEVLPYSAIGLLVVYALMNTKFILYPYGLTEIIAVITVWFLHKVFKNSLISIVGGTVMYMFLVQVIFV